MNVHPKFGTIRELNYFSIRYEMEAKYNRFWRDFNCKQYKKILVVAIAWNWDIQEKLQKNSINWVVWRNPRMTWKKLKWNMIFLIVQIYSILCDIILNRIKKKENFFLGHFTVSQFYVDGIWTCMYCIVNIFYQICFLENSFTKI